MNPPSSPDLFEDSDGAFVTPPESPILWSSRATKKRKNNKINGLFQKKIFVVETVADSGEDFFDSFKNRPISKVKKFNFKEYIAKKKRENNTPVVQKCGVVSTMVTDKEIESSDSNIRISNNENNLNRTLSNGEASKNHPLILNNGSTKNSDLKDSFIDDFHKPSTSSRTRSQIDKNKEKKSPIENNNLKSVEKEDLSELQNQTIEPKKFVFKKVSNTKDDSEEFRNTYPHTEVMNQMLHQKFGLEHFRPHQKEIINASLATRHDCFVLMPTGGGKSLCYQLPAILTPGVTIVISALRALIIEQVDKLNALDIPAAHLCYDVKKSDVELIFEKLHASEPVLKLLYLPPAKITSSEKVVEMIKSLYSRGKLTRFVIDEAHCVSQLGHNFRPDYEKLSCLRKLYPEVPIICLTATATKQVQCDVMKILNLNNVKIFTSMSINRPNIKYKVMPKTNKDDKVVKEISKLIQQKFYKKSGIIYCLCHGDCDKLARYLCRVGIKARPYHSVMSDSTRQKQQKEWMQNQYHVIVTTIAFGMGIDKPDVRYVIHYSIPKSVETFYQESGRAGHDGELSYSYLYYSYTDVIRLKCLMQKESQNRDNFENVNEMLSFCENIDDCRRCLQLERLGEKFDRKICMNNKETICDNCENIGKRHRLLDMTIQARELCRIVDDLASKENVTMRQVVDVYQGSKRKKVTDKGHNMHKYYGNGSSLDRTVIQRILVDLIVKKMLIDFCFSYDGKLPVVYLKPGEKFNTFKQEGFKISIPTREIVGTAVARRVVSENGKNNKSAINSLKKQCLGELLKQCRNLAYIKQVASFSTIMDFRAIKNMSEVLPTNQKEFMEIKYVTEANYKKYGEYFLKITTKYRNKLDDIKKQKATSFRDTSVVDDDELNNSQGSDDDNGTRKRKLSDGYKKNPKKFKPYINMERVKEKPHHPRNLKKKNAVR